MALLIGVAALAAFATFVFKPARAPSTTETLAFDEVNAIERPVDARIDAYRLQGGLPPVRFSAELTRAAEAHALTMARSGTFSHRSRGEKAFSLRLQSFYSARGFAYWATGENIFWAPSIVTAAQIVRAWIASPPHRLNLLDRRWRQVGVAALRVPAARGVYQGLDVTIVVAEFGTRTG